jgi:ABC-type phosphate transport system substrate-binding protein
MVANGVKPKFNRFTMVLGVIAATVTTLGFSATAVLSQNTSEVKIDGSSTVFPITEAVAEEFQAQKVQSFVQFYLEKDAELVREVGYIALPQEAYAAVRDRYQQRTTGSVFANRSTVGVRIQDTLRLEAQR